MSLDKPASIEVLLSRASESLAAGRTDLYCLPLLPLLEHPWSKVLAEVSKSVTQFKGLEDKADSLPTEVVTFALESQRPYWVGLALAWLEDGFPRSGRIKEELFSISQTKHIPQQKRHVAWKLHHENEERA